MSHDSGYHFHIWPRQHSREDTPPPVDSKRIDGQASNVFEKAGQVIAKNPRTAVVAAASLGVLLGWLTKRK